VADAPTAPASGTAYAVTGRVTSAWAGPTSATTSGAPAATTLRVRRSGLENPSVLAARTGAPPIAGREKTPVLVGGEPGS